MARTVASSIRTSPVICLFAMVNQVTRRFTPPGEALPVASIVGSSNYGYRSNDIPELLDRD